MQMVASSSHFCDSDDPFVHFLNDFFMCLSETAENSIAPAIVQTFEENQKLHQLSPEFLAKWTTSNTQDTKPWATIQHTITNTPHQIT